MATQTQQYLCLIYSNEANRAAQTPEEGAANMAAYHAFTQSIVKSGNFVAGDALQPTATATSVRIRSGETLITDGPFAETKEQLGGYYLIKAADLDEALAIAARIPTVEHGTIEVRPLFSYNS
ncbi:MAG: hypothetical protein ACI9U2_003948 [Bradymonadia bacterium]|jgi:hypothetical protein